MRLDVLCYGEILIDFSQVTTQAHYERTGVGMKGFPAKRRLRASRAINPFFLAVER